MLSAKPSLRFWLLPPLWLAFGCDVLFTLLGQTPEYWAGNYDKAIEENPLARPLLIESPFLFVALALIGMGALSLFIRYWKHSRTAWLPYLIAFVQTLAHTLGACSWLLRIETWGWPLSVLFLWITTTFSRQCWRWTFLNSSLLLHSPKRSGR